MDDVQKRLGRGGILSRVDLIVSEPVPEQRDLLQQDLLADLDGLASRLEQLSILDDLVFLARATIFSVRSGGPGFSDDSGGRRRARLVLANARGLARMMQERRRTLLRDFRLEAEARSQGPGVLEDPAQTLALRRSRLNRRVDAMLRLLSTSRRDSDPI